MKPVHAIVLAFVLRAAGALADPASDPGALTFSAFGTLGAAHNDARGAEFIRDVLQARGVEHGWSADVDSRAGAQVNYRRNGLEAMAQATYAYDHTGGYGADLTWAFLGYSPSDAWRVRAGRVGWDVYMQSDTRNVGYSYLWVRPPVEYFGWLVLSHIDGGDVVAQRAVGPGVASLKVYGGLADQRITVQKGESYDVSGTRVAGANLDYRIADWMMRVGYTNLRMHHRLELFEPIRQALEASGLPNGPSLARELAVEGKTLEEYSVGLVYDRSPWLVQAMAARATSNTLAFPQRDFGFVHLGYRAHAFTPYAIVSAARSRETPRATGLPLPNPLDAGLGLAIAANRSRQSTLSAGVRWDFTRNADLKLQVDRVHVIDHAAALWRTADPGWNGKATVVSVALDFVF